MPRTCSVCAHPDRTEIDAALAKDVPLLELAEQYDLSAPALCRHGLGHARGRRARQKTRPPSPLLVERADAIYRTTLRLAENPDLLHDPDLFLKVLARLESQCHLLRRLDPTGKLASPPPDATDKILPVLFAALDAFPDALNSVIGALDELRRQS